MEEKKPSRIAFSPRQAAIVTNAISFAALCSILVISGLLLQLALGLVQRYQSVLFPPLLAIILAKIVQPVFDGVRRTLCVPIGRLPVSRTRTLLEGIATAVAILAALATILGPFVLFLSFFGHLVVEQVFDLVRRIPDLCRELWNRAMELTAGLRGNETAMRLLSRLDPHGWMPPRLVAEGLTSGAIGVFEALTGLIGAIGSWLMVPVYMTIFLASRPIEGSDLVKLTVGLDARTRHNVVYLIDTFVGIVVSFFRGQVLVAIIEGCLFGLGFQFLASVPYGMTLGLLVGFVNIVPYMGAVFVMPVVCAVAWFSGGAGTLLAVVAVWIGVGVADFYITPRIVGNRTGLGVFAVIFSILFWGSVIGGFVGVFLAVPLTAFLFALLQFVRREYFPAEEEAQRSLSSSSPDARRPRP